MQEYEIKISGSGTRAELIAALLKVNDGIATFEKEKAIWGDHILITEIKST
jgi:hypothetical protein